MAIREGRQKVPANPVGGFRQGMGVVIDAANPGFIKLLEPGDPTITGYSGLLVQEEAWDVSIYGTSISDSFGLGSVHNNRLCTVWSGNGTKVWFKNTPAQVRVDGRSIDAVELVDFGTPPAIGDYLGVTAPGVWGVVADPAEAQMVVTLSNGTDYLEAVLIK